MAAELTGKGMAEKHYTALSLPYCISEASSWFIAEAKEHYQYDSYLLELSLNKKNGKAGSLEL